ncbi:RecQ-mediated genome instability protein 1 [Colletotrichum chlorophyti]|uniref:RecQ-mediated genome instability protein 1 n=1 Tax=Colletotrichum chlorophyti TaxID=708187 RepID=A0A1Q8S3Y6_9PEZI|nr:RecQ-mediated genome instability protein 1 [Colletotrichum chlorophyti]
MDLTTQIRTTLKSQFFLIPSTTWTATLTSRVPTPPLPSLIATAKARLLASDLTTPGLLDESSTGSLPARLLSPETPETILPHDVPCQVLDIENLSLSRWEQVEELEAVARGEQTTGRRIVRLAAEESEYDNVDEGGVGVVLGRPPQQQQQQQQRRNATHRLVLQDCKGQKIYAMELRRMENIGTGSTNIGEKVVLKSGTVIARGMVLLEPEKCVMLGGKIDAWQRAWVEGRMARLKEVVGAERS